MALSILLHEMPCMLCALQISHNRSLDGVLDLLNSKHMT